MMWTEKYRPRTIEEVVGNEYAKRGFIEWIKGRGRGGRREMGVFLVGPQGVGKTSLVHAAARQLGFHVFELNASDVRTQKMLSEALCRIMMQRPLDAYTGDGKGKILVFLDEVEGIHGVADRGGLKALIDFASKRGVSLVLSANFPDPEKHGKLLKGFRVIRFWPLTTRQTILALWRIVEEESLSVEREVIRRIASQSKGDVRSAVNMLHSVAVGYKGIEEISIVETLPLKETLSRILVEEDEKRILELISASLVPPEKIYRALAEAASTSDLDIDVRARALEALSRIDVLMGRIRRRGRWKMLRELIHMMPGVAVILHGSNVVYSDRIPDYLLSRYMYSNRQRRLMGIADKVRGRLNLSTRKAVSEVLPFLSLQIESGRREVARGMGLNEEEGDFLVEALSGEG